MTDQRPGRTPVLSLASYNIHRCFGTDRLYSPERILDVLRGLDADVVALQEVDMRLLADHRHQLEFLAESLGVDFVSGPNIEDHRGKFGNALLTRHPVRHVQLLDLSVRRFEPRGAILAQIEVRGQTVLVVGTHLGLNAGERRLQVQRLLHAVGEQAGGMPIVLMGDCNEWKPNHGALRSLNRLFGQSMMPRTFPSRLPVLPLDRIWVSPRNGLRRISVYAAPLARVASDHLPVRAEVSWDHGDLPKAWQVGQGISQG